MSEHVQQEAARPAKPRDERRRTPWRPGVPAKKFFGDLRHEIQNDNVSNGAAALAYYWMFAIFPAAIFLLSLLPYLPIPNLEQAIMDMLGQAMPGEAAGLLRTTVENVTSTRSGGLLSFGILGTIWAGSAGLYAVMQQLNITYDVKEERPFWKARGTSILLMLLFALLVIGAFGLIVFGGVLQDALASRVGDSPILLAAFAGFRWLVILGLLLLGFAVTYYFGPNVQQRFSFITPGSVAGVVIIVIAALGFRIYVENFASFDKTYGSLGAVIVLLFWLYITGLVLLLGAEINALLEHYADTGKQKGEKEQPGGRRRADAPS